MSRPARSTARRRPLAPGVLTLAAVLALAACGADDEPVAATSTAPPASASAAPTTAADPVGVVALPADFAPEGIAGDGRTFWAGSRPGPQGGAVYRGDLTTGRGEVLVPATPGGASIGMQDDPESGLLWVAGGPTGTVTAYDATTGEQRTRVTAPRATAEPFLNDVDVVDGVAYVTDSRNARLLVVRDGALEVLPLTGQWEQAAEGNSANGIRALPDGDLLLVSNGDLYRVDPGSGAATRLEQTGGPDLTGGDGLELDGSTLYVVYGEGTDSVSVVQLSQDGTGYEVTRTLTKDTPEADDLERPTTAYADGTYLWVVNGKFMSPPSDDQEIVRLQP